MKRCSWLLLLLGAAADYSPELGKLLLLFSDAAYCGGSASEGKAAQEGVEDIMNWSCPPCREVSLLGAKVSSPHIFLNSSMATFGFTGLVEAGNTTNIVVSFRGSVLEPNFKLDAAIFPLQKFNSRDGLVHAGMLWMYESIRSQMLEQVASLRRQVPAASTILVTGHSLGASMAALAALDLASAQTTAEVVMISFGSPKTGDAAFRSVFKALRNLKTYTVVHRADIVPQCGIHPAPCPNQSVLHQLGQNIWYPDGLAKAGHQDYIECCCDGEDPSCEDSVSSSQLNWKDHDWYLEHSLYCCSDGATNTGAADPRHCKFPFSSPPNRRSQLPWVLYQ